LNTEVFACFFQCHINLAENKKGALDAPPLLPVT